MSLLTETRDWPKYAKYAVLKGEAKIAPVLFLN